ncbi:hypothetical protein L218DRAFT_1034217 [Marasmius fiardii PR-910]|nr:hypothetical protein L218DRAFT_1034217 [Marasmius fiardii PR-910]
MRRGQSMAYYNLEYLIHHIFLPPQLPQSDDSSAENDHDLCSVVLEAARAFGEGSELSDKEKKSWKYVVRMLERLCSLYGSESYTKDELEQRISEMVKGDVTAFFIRAQNAGLIIRKLGDRTVYESFEVSVPNEVVMRNRGKIICSYPGPAIAVRSDKANNPHFISELANFLAQMNVDVFEDAMPTTRKAGSRVLETRETTHPRFITELLTGILRGMGSPEDVPRIAKRIADDILWNNALLPWRRSPLWLVIRVALQTSLQDAAAANSSHLTYKSFMAFLMSMLLRKSAEADLKSDLLSVMHKKVARRLYKIRDTAPEFVRSEVVGAGEALQALLRQRWEVVQEQYAHGSIQRWDPASLKVRRDTVLSLENSKRYIFNALNKKDQSSSPPVFKPDEHPRLKSLHQHTKNSFIQALKQSGELALFDFERAVEDEIDGWVSDGTSSDSKNRCSLISDWITLYAREAKSRYSGNPEEMSMMFLTLLELWIGLDKLCVSHCDLLFRYPPEVKEEFFTPLLLRRAKSIDRLKLAIQYLRKRQGTVNPDLPSIFSSQCTSTSFSVVFFNSSSALKSLRESIERRAQSNREKKVKELSKKNQLYRDLSQRVSSLEHQFMINPHTNQQSHNPTECERCNLEQQMVSMTIEVLEWPLPSDTCEAKETVFELSPPTMFNLWRDTTYFFLRDICTLPTLRNSTSTPKAEIELNKYPALIPFMSFSQFSSGLRRLMLASATKAWGKTHYKEVRIPATESQVCLRNGLRLQLFDTLAKVWVSQPFAGVSIASQCTFKLPSGPYSNLQYAVDSTTHTTNHVLASQSECSRDLSLHEYLSFGMLRAGARLQWLNLLRELRARIMTFSQDAVEMLIAQTALQMGPLSQDGCWEWHEELYDPIFQLRLLNELKDWKDSIQANWSEVATMRTIILLTHRVIIWSRDDRVATAAHLLLQECMLIAYRWMKDVNLKLQKANDNSQLSNLRLSLCDMACTCRNVFYLDPQCYARLQLPLDIMLEAGFILRDNLPLDLMTRKFSLRAKFFTLDRRLCYSFESFLTSTTAEGNTAFLNQAILEYWPSYTPGTSWVQQPEPNDRWLCSKGSSCQVAYNVLENQLLINGKPLGRLPSEILSHVMYSRLFGQIILDVVPSDEFGAQFATKDFFSGYQVLFQLLGAGKFVIKARCCKTNKKFQLIPHTVFSGDLPQLFIDDYVHWLNLDEDVIELRPLSSPWISSSENWCLELSTKPYLWQNSSVGAIRLVDVRSRTATMIAERLQCFEPKEFLTVTCSMQTLSVTVDIPRYRLSFQLSPEGQLLCLTLPGMMIDDNQSAGIMIGLQNRLVLRDRESSMRRELLVPVGEISFSFNGYHVWVSIDTGSQRRVSYYRYVIDDILGRIIENTGLHAKLYKIYLIAITSHCLPDPLTGRTGTEEALHELQSASCCSFIQVDPEARAVLNHIHSLSPQRSYYPKYLQVMQTVEWQNISFLTQNDLFYQSSQAVLDFAAKLQVFEGTQSSSSIQDSKSESVTLLMERAIQRNSCFNSPSLQPLHQNSDYPYTSRDVSGHNEACNENLVFSYSSLITSWPSQLPTTPVLLQELVNWSNLQSLNITSVSYSQYWTTKPLSETWFHLYNLLQGKHRWKNGARYQILFTLCAIGYTHREPKTGILLSSLLASAIHCKPFLSLPKLSHNHSYDLSKGFGPDRNHLAQVAWNSSKPFVSNDLALVIPADGYYDLEQRRYTFYQQIQQFEIQHVVELVMQGWPSQKPNLPSNLRGWLRVVNIDYCHAELTPFFVDWFHNYQLWIHFSQAQLVLNRTRSTESFTLSTATKYTFQPKPASNSKPLSSVSFLHLFQKEPSFILEPLPTLQSIHPTLSTHYSSHDSESTYSGLHGLINSLHSHGGTVHTNYANDLHTSLAALQAETHQYTTPNISVNALAELHTYQKQCEFHLHQLLGNIQTHLAPPVQDIALHQAGLWPHIELCSLLESIASVHTSRPPYQWILVLQYLAQSLLLCQRSRRLLRLAQQEKYDDFWKEVEVDLSVMGTSNCDWLLIQADGDFIARPVQFTVAQEMISPSTEQNSLLQFNMGEGKSSVIVPMVAAALADGTRLARVVVLKSLAGQMFSLLRQRLSGLANRQILCLPFSRGVKIEHKEAQQIWELFQYAKRTRSILIAQPEHILSFKLMAVHRLVERDALSKLLVDTQLWLDEYSRDLLDESDEILHTRYQLIYTVGNQQTIEHGAERWTLIQQVLSLLKTCVLSVQNTSLSGLEVGESSGNIFPSIRVLESEGGAQLISKMLKCVMEGALANFYIERFPLRVREVAKSFIMNEDLSASDTETLKNHCSSDSALWKNLLLLRGLFGYGILIYTLKERRWRVDHGLDLSRSLLAVPYRAKDVPSLRAEFGHPDVAIILTCLSYLYRGLLQSEMEACFQLLFKLDSPEQEYDHWVHFSNVPEELRSIAGINLKDSEQRHNVLFPVFRQNRACINFYLSKIVFPKAMKEFPYKLGTSGWDLACQKEEITTGFSGTNENRYLLPTSISQEDAPERISTNASMLVILSRPENDWYMSPSTHSLSGCQIIDAMVDNTKKNDIRVLLDVGAQILEMTNVQVAKYWLARRPDVLAAVFFNARDELEVLTRDGTTEILSMSPFSQRLDDCLVYLDDAHTRGTDLKLPATWKACVTLGPKVTKDRLAQGCMRMRKLGHGQSVMFMAPPNIDNAIRKRANKLDPFSTVNSHDVLLWAMLETCEEIEHHFPRWLQQGVDFHTRNEGWKVVSAAQDPSEVSEIASSTWLQPEARSLQDWYGVSPNSTESELAAKARDIPEIWAHCKMLNIASTLDPRLAEEQEREVSHELERELEIQRPPAIRAAEHTLHRDVRKFVEEGSGYILMSSGAFGSAFMAVRDGMLIWCPISTSKPILFATQDYLKTVRAASNDLACDYIQPLNWALTNRFSSSIVILSPYEVNQLLPVIRKSKNVRLHLYTPRTIRSMRSTEDLQLYTIGPSITSESSWPLPNREAIDQLNLCAGQLYFSNYDAYLRTSTFLGISTPEDKGHDMKIEGDGFVKPENRVGQLASNCKFEKNPIPYLKALIGFRRRGMTFETTHIGKVLNGRLLRESDFGKNSSWYRHFFRTLTILSEPQTQWTTMGQKLEETGETPRIEFGNTVNRG